MMKEMAEYDAKENKTREGLVIEDKPLLEISGKTETESSMVRRMQAFHQLLQDNKHGKDLKGGSSC